MIDFPITDLFDDSLCLLWLERRLHPDGFVCPQCGRANHRRFRVQGHYDAYRCRACDAYYSLLSGTAFEGSRQRPATLVLLLRGITKGESTARLARELQLSRQTVHTLRQRLQTNLNDSTPTSVMEDQTFEVDELYQNAGKKSTLHRDPDEPPAAAPLNSRATGPNATVNHSQHEWARDDDGDGVREVHCNTCEGTGAALRTFLRPFRGVHKAYLHYYVATYEALVNAKQVSPALICRMCWPPKQPPHAYWT